MLKNIKSSYFLKIIFSYTNEKTKLKLVKYDKSLQKKIGINLLNFKVFSGRYIIYTESGRAIEYMAYYDKLIYEGGYLNGARNGKGKEYEYWVGKLIYEGEYLNGARNGKGKEYYYNNKLKIKFDGEYLKGKKWNGRGYDNKNKIIYELKNGTGFIKEFNGLMSFEEEYLNGERNGKGKEFFKNDLIFEGEYLNGERNGKGKEYYNFDKLKFDGEYKKGKKWNGKGYDNKNNIIYELKNGKGYIKNYDIKGNLLFEGEYLNGELFGKVKEYINNKLIFEGDFLNGKKNGKGKEYDSYNDYLIFEGEYLNGQKNGKGKEYYNNILKFEGEYLYGRKIKGREYMNGRLEYEGDYLYDRKYNGKGYDENGNIIYELINGNGTVKEYDEEGNLLFEGEYSEGKRWNGKIIKGFNVDDNSKIERQYLNGKEMINFKFWMCINIKS